MTTDIAVTATDPALLNKARQLADQLGLPLLDHNTPPPPLLLQLTPRRLELQPTGRRAPGPVYADFLSGKLSHRRRQGGGRRQHLARAVGLKGRQEVSVIDATAGLGRDAFILADLGCRVLLLERNPVIHALLADGLARAMAAPETAELVGKRMQLLTGDALTFLEQSRCPAAEVIYLDPMFPERTKSSLVKKEMLVLRRIAGDDPDAGQLLARSLEKAGRRVVVKRPRLAPALPGPPPSFSLSGKSSRFDVYLINRRP